MGVFKASPQKSRQDTHPKTKILKFETKLNKQTLRPGEDKRLRKQHVLRGGGHGGGEGVGGVGLPGPRRTNRLGQEGTCL